MLAHVLDGIIIPHNVLKKGNAYNMLIFMEERRKEMGLRQSDLGKAVGIPQTTYSSYETGAREMPVRTAKKIAQALNVEWWKLYEEDGDDIGV